MAVYGLTSAAGSPGVTTVALGLALQWPGEVLLIDADPVGGSPILAGFYGGAVAHPGTLIELWSAHRQGSLPTAIRELPLRLSETARSSLAQPAPRRLEAWSSCGPPLPSKLVLCRRLESMSWSILDVLGMRISRPRWRERPTSCCWSCAPTFLRWRLPRLHNFRPTYPRGRCWSDRTARTARLPWRR